VKDDINAILKELKELREQRDEAEAARISASLPEIGRDGTVAVFVRRRKRSAVGAAVGEGEG